MLQLKSFPVGKGYKEYKVMGEDDYTFKIDLDPAKGNEGLTIFHHKAMIVYNRYRL